MSWQAILFVALLLLTSRSSAAEPPTFEKDIRPIFRSHCYDCHGATEKIEGKLDLRLVRFMERGGESGPAIQKGNAADSYLVQRVQDGEMPPGEHRLPAHQIAILQQWINAGAPTARPEPTVIGPGLGITLEERDYWAFAPIERPPVPNAPVPNAPVPNAPVPNAPDLQVDAIDRVRTPIDAFLLARMAPAGLMFAEDADKATLIRRAYLDLIGLPPTPEQVDRFLVDDSENAWEKVVAGLLNSPHYGERWGRHWLDVAGFADSEGATNRDDLRAWAYKYRDWVIQAFNHDMPFDQFLTWQLAGDELAERPYKNMSPEQINKLTATGFLRMAADGTGSMNDELARNQVMTDTIKIVSSALLGMSVGCAQCHDHRYDPISQADYYRLRAVFEPAINYRQWLRPAERRVSLYTDEDIAAAARVEEDAQVKTAERTAKQSEYMKAALQAELAKHEESLREPLAEAYQTPSDQRSAAQQGLLKKHPNIEKLHPGVLYQYNQKHADELKEFDKQIAAIRAKKPQEQFLRALTEPEYGTRAPVTQLFYRGDYRQPQQDVAPGGLTATVPLDHEFLIPMNSPALPSTGRRLAYARWLTSGRHPLVARVLVNRFWLHHFGKTFVATADEFGRLGSLPTHPKLIDWLADEFMASDWSLKHLHRLIVCSTVYQQQSLRSTQSDLVDGANDLYSHFPVRRLEAEVIRDSILAISGRLDTNPFGPADEVSPDGSGQVVTQGDRQRRSVYLQVRRTQPMALLKSFDAPVMETNCGRRESSTDATQSLMLMNSEFILQFAQAFADRISTEAQGKVDAPITESHTPPDDSDGSDPPSFTVNSAVVSQLVYGWQLAYGRTPTREELGMSLEFYREQLELLKQQSHEQPGMQAVTNYCQALLISNEFLYVE